MFGATGHHRLQWVLFVCFRVVFSSTMQFPFVKITFYNNLSEPPDATSIHLVGNSSSVVVDTEFQLQCSITKVAPVADLTVRWYRDDRLYEPRRKGQVKLSLGK